MAGNHFWKHVAIILGCCLFMSCVVTCQQLDNIECPNPQGLGITNQVDCDRFTACKWTGIQCRMEDNSKAGYTATASPTPTAQGYTIPLSKIDPYITMFEEDIYNPIFEVINHEDHHLQIKIYDSARSRYEVPVPLNLPSSAGTNPLYEVITTSNVGEPFSFSVQRVATGTTIFNLLGPLSFEDKFIQITTSLPSSNLYGFGENTHLSFKHTFEPRVTQPMWPRDQPVATNKVINQYSYHPYYSVVEDDEGNSHSVLLFTSNAMEYSTFNLEANSPGLTLRTIGGIVDLHFFLGPTPEDVNKQYINMIGLPTLPPYYALGFHLSRYGYGSSANAEIVYDRNRAAGIPQDVQTFDIDYMDRYRDFTYDSQGSYATFPQLVDKIHSDNLKVTIILDPALVIDFDNYPPGQNGVDQDVYIKWMKPEYIPSDQPPQALDYIVGYVWPDEKTVFPDFFKPSCVNWWANESQTFHQSIAFDALWIDMNEVANFGTDLNRPFNYPPELPDWSLKCPFTEFDNPPYGTIAAYQGDNQPKRLCDKTICLSSNQTDGVNMYLQYDVHVLYGWSQSVATEVALNRLFPGKRQLIYSRSTYPGSGKYVFHWLGDNTSNFENLRVSIIGLFEFNMFGIPTVGADVCGFFNDATGELCARWMELGAFYPFDRNHNTIGTQDQDPAWEGWSSYGVDVASISRDVLLLRYKFLPFLYTLFYRAHVDGSTVIRPLFNVFPSDTSNRDIDDQFFWGSQMMVAPVISENTFQRNVYFPQGLWYEISTGVLEGNGPMTSNIAVPIEYIPVYVRGGSILPFQDPDVTTALSRTNLFGFLIALDPTESASGEVFWDDGDSILSTGNYYLAQTQFTANTFTLTVQEGAPVASSVTVGHIHVYGFPTTPTTITVNGNGLTPSEWTYNASTQVLDITISETLGADLTVAIA